MPARVTLTDDEAEITILALEYFKREHLGDYEDPADRRKIAAEITSAERKLREA